MAGKIKELRKKYDGKLLVMRNNDRIPVAFYAVRDVFWDKSSRSYALQCSCIAINHSRPYMEDGASGFDWRGPNHHMYVDYLKRNKISIASPKTKTRIVREITDYLLNFCGMTKEDIN